MLSTDGIILVVVLALIVGSLIWMTWTDEEHRKKRR